MLTQGIVSGKKEEKQRGIGFEPQKFTDIEEFILHNMMTWFMSVTLTKWNLTSVENHYYF